MRTLSQSHRACLFVSWMLLAGCDGSPSPTYEVESDDAEVFEAGIEAPDDGARDASVAVDAIPPPDAAPPPLDVAVDAAIDAAVEDAAVDAAPPTEEVCNGLDDDQDGLIDEEVSNICGGCGEIPEGGCQSWRVDLAQDAEGRFNPNRAVTLLGVVTRSEVLELEGATCDRLEISGAAAPDHLGVVSISSARAEVQLIPSFDPASGLSYAPSPALDPLPLYEGAERVRVAGMGSEAFEPFEASILGVAPVAEVDGLDGLLEKATGVIRGETPLSWAPTGAGPILLYIGGSRPLFSRPGYQSIEHFQMSGALEDDGESVIPDLFDGGLPDSSVWVYLERSRALPLIFGPHAVLLQTRARTEARVSGSLEGDLPTPVRFEWPDPAAPEVEVGAPLPVRWAPLPEGEGPLRVSLTIHIRESGLSRQVTCEVADPASGELIFPAELLDLPIGEGDTRQVTLSWVSHSASLSAPDEGTLTRSTTTLLRLP